MDCSPIFSLPVEIYELIGLQFDGPDLINFLLASLVLKTALDTKPFWYLKSKSLLSLWIDTPEYSTSITWKAYYAHHWQILNRWHINNPEAQSSFMLGGEVCGVAIHDHDAVAGTDYCTALCTNNGTKTLCVDHLAKVRGLHINQDKIYCSAVGNGFREIDRATGKFYDYKGCEEIVWSVMPFGNRIVCSSTDVYVWNRDTKKLIKKLKVGNTVSSVKINDKYIIAGSWDTKLRVWDSRTYDLLYTLTGHSKGIRCVDIAGNRAVSVSSDNTCILWNLDKGLAIKEVKEPLQPMFHSVKANKVFIATLGRSFVRIIDWNGDMIHTLDVPMNLRLSCVTFNMYRLVVGGLNCNDLSGTLWIKEFGKKYIEE